MQPIGIATRLIVAAAAVTLLSTRMVVAETGTTSGKVVKTGETLVVQPAQGEAQTFFVSMKQKGDGWVREPLADIALKKALRPGVPVTVDWSVGEAGRKYIGKLTATGSVTGTVVEPRERGILCVAVAGIDGPMRFVSRWVQGEDKWIPDPKEVEIASVAAGAKVTVEYMLEEHFRINQLTVVK